MREIVYYSSKASTYGNFSDLVSAGRLDIACHAILQSILVSHRLRSDTILHLVFDGPPYAPKHLEIHGDAPLPFLKNNISKALKRMLYRGNHKREEVFPGYFVEKKSLLDLLVDMKKDGKNVYILDGKGSDLRDIEDNSWHFLGYIQTNNAKKVIVTLPEPKILSHEVYPKVDKLDVGWMRELKNDDFNDNFNVLRREFRRDAMESDVFHKSKQEVEKLMQTIFLPMVQSIDKRYQVEVRYRGNSLPKNDPAWD
jgi:tRNA pseudouridine-54 N-methylase